jgi:hypothetical protein
MKKYNEEIKKKYINLMKTKKYSVAKAATECNLFEFIFSVCYNIFNITTV